MIMYIKTEQGYFKSFNGTDTAEYTEDITQAFRFHCGIDSANWTGARIGAPYTLVTA
jgi:hypothetical protein